jgi:hypothetical protein
MDKARNKTRVLVRFVLSIDHATGVLRLLPAAELERGKSWRDVVPLCTTQCAVKVPDEADWFYLKVKPAVRKAIAEWEAVHVNEELVWEELKQNFFKQA